MTLEEINRLPSQDVETEFLKCCGSTRWAKRMAEARPFTDANHLLSKADEIWWSLSTDDWLEAFRAHPKIGEKKAATAQSAEAQRWSAQEQSQSQQAAAETKAALAEGNLRYEDRFGFIFIVCAAGKSAGEILASLSQRLGNNHETERRIAADEQRKITQLRLNRLVDSSSSK